MRCRQGISEGPAPHPTLFITLSLSETIHWVHNASIFRLRTGRCQFPGFIVQANVVTALYLHIYIFSYLILNTRDLINLYSHVHIFQIYSRIYSSIDKGTQDLNCTKALQGGVGHAICLLLWRAPARDKCAKAGWCLLK